MKTKHVFYALLAVLGLWGLSWILIVYVGPFCGWEQRAQFGSMFGAVEALFSGLAFAGIILTILLQREELQLQRRDLELTRKELEGQKEQLKIQNKTLRQQQLENTFFQLLKLHTENVNAIDTFETGARDARIEISGRDCLKKYCEELRGTYGRTKSSNSNAGKKENEVVELAYRQFFLYHQIDIGHYFTHMYNIVKFVHFSELQEKQFYTNLLRAQLSGHELLLLFYNCLSSFGSEKFKPLVDKYFLLKYLPKEMLFSDSHCALYYGTSDGSNGAE